MSTRPTTVPTTRPTRLGRGPRVAAALLALAVAVPAQGVELTEFLRPAPPQTVREVHFEAGAYHVYYQRDDLFETFPFPLAPGASQSSASGTLGGVQLVRDHEGRVLARAMPDDDGVGFDELVDARDGSVRALPEGTDGLLRVTRSGTVVHVERERHGQGHGVVEVSLPGEDRFRARRVEGLTDARLSPDGETLFVRTNGAVQVYRTRDFAGGASARTTVSVTGDYHYLPASASFLTPAGAAEEVTAFALVHGGATSLYSSGGDGKTALLRQTTVGYAKGVEWLRSGLVLIAEANAVHVHLAKEGGTIEARPTLTFQDEDYTIESLAATSLPGDEAVVALGLRHVLRTRTRDRYGEAHVGLWVLHVAADGTVTTLADERHLSSRLWNYASPEVVWGPDGSEALVHCRDVVWLLKGSR